MVHAFGELVNWLQVGLPAFLFVITLVVFFHELGHFLVARYFGVAVETFSIGFGPAIFGWKDKKGTLWKVSWIPFGGYVKFFGDADAASTPDRDALERMSPEQRANAFQNKPLLHRAWVVAAGPIANFILGLVIFAAALFFFGEQAVRPVIGTVAPNSAAAVAGLKPGDLVTAVNGKHITTFSELHTRAALHPGRELAITVSRDHRSLVLHATPRLTPSAGAAPAMGSLGIQPHSTPLIVKVPSGSAAAAAGLKPGDLVRAIDDKPIHDLAEMLAAVEKSGGRTLTLTIERGQRTLTLKATPRLRQADSSAKNAPKVWLLGVNIAVAPRDIVVLEYGFWASLKTGAHQVWFVVENTLAYLWQIVTGQAGLGQLSGPVGIAHISQEVAGIGFGALLKLAAFLSVSIGLVNLFPVPILDGGHLLYYGCEAVLGRPLGARAQDVGFRVGLAVMLGLMVLATWNDLVQLKLF